MLKNKLIENADLTGRVCAAAKSLAAWYRQEQYRLIRERTLFRANLFGPELDRAVGKNLTEKRLLDNGWQNSSLRQHIESREENDSGHIGGGIERRSILTTSMSPSTRATGTSSRLTAKSLYGYVAKYDSLSEDLGGFREKIQRDAFAEAIKKSDVRMLFNHSADYIFGRTSSATLELKEDSVGLRFVCYLLPFDPQSYALARRVDRRDVSGCSFSFTTQKDRWIFAQKLGETDVRILEEIDNLYDVGPVTYPAYRQTSVQAVFEELPARSASQTSETARDFEIDSDTDCEKEVAFYAARDKKLADELRERRRKTEIGYKQALRIINRVKAKLL